MADTACKPYRLEWRADLLGPSARWQLITPESDLATAQRHADEWTAKRGGQCRVIEQQVVYVTGHDRTAAQSRAGGGDRLGVAFGGASVTPAKGSEAAPGRSPASAAQEREGGNHAH